MAGIIWSRQGLKDFSDHLAHIASDSPQNARQVATKIIEKIELLIDFPKMGRVVPELSQENIREIIVYNYRIVYRLKDIATIEIITIHHSKKLLVVRGD